MWGEDVSLDALGSAAPLARVGLPIGKVETWQPGFMRRLDCGSDSLDLLRFRLRKRGKLGNGSIGTVTLLTETGLMQWVKQKPRTQDVSAQVRFELGQLRPVRVGEREPVGVQGFETRVSLGEVATGAL